MTAVVAPLIAFEVPGIPPSPNTTRRLNWHQNSEDANVWKDATCIALFGSGKKRHSRLTDVRLEIIVLTSSGRRRDPDNMVAACKPIIDGLVLAGVLSDDSFAVIRSLSIRQERSDRTAIRIEIWPPAVSR